MTNAALYDAVVLARKPRTSHRIDQVVATADHGALKRVIGDGLRSRTDRRRATEVGIAVNAMNRMLELGRPEYVRLP